MFGPERAGLDNAEVVLADAVLAVPANPGYSSLNLAQAVLLVGYEWFQAADPAPLASLAPRGYSLPLRPSGTLTRNRSSLRCSGFWIWTASLRCASRSGRRGVARGQASGPFVAGDGLQGSAVSSPASL